MKEVERKQFYKTFIEDNRTEDEKMLDAIHENARKRLINEEKAANVKSYAKKEKRFTWGDFVLLIGIYATDLVIIGLLITLVVKVWR